MQLVVRPGGTTHCLYGEDFPLAALGRLQIRRASHVEPDTAGQWTADLRLVGGPVLGPFVLRSEALAAERQWLLVHWLVKLRSQPATADLQD